MNWTISIDDSCKKELQKLDPQSQKLILNYLYNKVARLDHPRLLGKSLRKNLKGYWRYRVDKFRIICQIKEGTFLVLALKIGKRDEIYELFDS